MPDPRGQLLRAALGFAGCSMPSYDRALWALRTWLDSWSGIGHVTVGMARQKADAQLLMPTQQQRQLIVELDELAAMVAVDYWNIEDHAARTQRFPSRMEGCMFDRGQSISVSSSHSLRERT